MKNQSTLLILATLIAAGCSGGGDAHKVNLPKSQSPADATPIVAVTPSDRHEQLGAGGASASSQMVFSGSIEAQRTSSVATRVGGLIRKVHVTEGDAVKKGDLLVEIDSDDYRLRVEASRATLERVQAQVKALKVQHDRAAQLLSRTAIPQSDFDSVDGQFNVSVASVKEAEVALKMARSTLSDSQIRAPYDGTVTNVAAVEGNYAQAGPSALLSLEESTALRIRVQLPESYISSVKVGTPLRVRFLGSDAEAVFPITHINPSINPRSRSFSVLAQVDNTNQAYRAGMFVEARLGETK
jgi:RND family efflux transporter MFP subunit